MNNLEEDPVSQDRMSGLKYVVPYDLEEAFLKQVRNHIQYTKTIKTLIQASENTNLDHETLGFLCGQVFEDQSSGNDSQGLFRKH